MSKQHRFGVGVALAVMLAAGGVLAGELTPPGPPGSTMYTLEDIYLAVTGDSNVVNTTSGDAVAGEILAGKKAWAGGAEVTGTMPNVGQQNVTPGTSAQTITAGYHDGTGSVAGDTDLVAGNIKKDVTIFGVTGTHEGEGGGGTYNAAVPQTGQTTSYASGDDGDLEKGVAWPNPRFTDNSDGTVTDNLTGLIWLKNANAFGFRGWATALTDCATLNSGEAGLSDGSVEGDWRLPNIRELQSLIDYGRYNPALPSGHPFTGVQSGYYWSSSTVAVNTVFAWSVALDGGYVSNGYKPSTDYVWPVRGGQ